MAAATNPTPNPRAKQDSPALLTIAEACGQLRVSRWMLYQLIRSNRLRTVQIGRRRFIPTVSMSRFLNELGAGDQ